TYLHVAGAILAFLGLEYALFQGLPGSAVESMLFRSGLGGMLVLMLLFIGVGYLARVLARSETSMAAKYLGLALYVGIRAVSVYPLLWLAQMYPPNGDLIKTAGIYTLCLFGGLTLSVFITRKDFSFLAPIISIASFLMLGLIVCAMI